MLAFQPLPAKMVPPPSLSPIELSTVLSEGKIILIGGQEDALELVTREEIFLPVQKE